MLWVAFLASVLCQALGHGQDYKILLFGDSLTAGFHDRGLRYHPYSKKFEELLKANNIEANVTQQGITGERVLQTMEGRINGLLLEAHQGGRRYNWVVVMAGINDVGWGASAPDIAKGLGALYRACINYGAQVLALTTLQTAFSTDSANPHERTRQQLNGLILQACQDQGLQGKLFCLDMEQRLPNAGMPEAERRVYWDDALHLTPAGYDRLGSIVFEALACHLSPVLKCS